MSSYVGRIFLVRFLFMLICLTTILQFLDLLDRSDKIMEAEGADLGSIIRYLRLRLPQLISLMLPFSSLLAALATYATLNQHSEITIMKTAGMSSFRIVMPLVITILPVAVMHFVFNETIVVAATGELEAWEATNYAINEEPPVDNSGPVWAVDGSTLIRAQNVLRGGTILDNIKLIYREESRITRTIAADFAAFSEGKWTLFEVRIFSLDDFETTIIPTMAWGSSVSPERFLVLSVDPEKIGFFELRKSLVEMVEEGQSVNLLLSWLHNKVAGPAGSLLMPLLAAVAGFGVHRAGFMMLRAVIGMGLGFSYFIVDNVLITLGEFGSLPPILAAWTPFLLYLCLGTGIILFTEE